MVAGATTALAVAAAATGGAATASAAAMVIEEAATALAAVMVIEGAATALAAVMVAAQAVAWEVVNSYVHSLHKIEVIMAVFKHSAHVKSRSLAIKREVLRLLE